MGRYPLINPRKTKKPKKSLNLYLGNIQQGKIINAERRQVIIEKVSKKTLKESQLPWLPFSARRGKTSLS